MMITEAKIMKWGNSYGLLLPKNVIDKANFHIHDKVMVELKRKYQLEELFGLCKLKKPTKVLIKEIRAGYND